MRQRAGALIFQTGKPIRGEGGQDRRDMVARELEAAGDTLLLPAIVKQTHDLPSGLVGVLEFVKQGPLQGELDRERVLIEKAADGMMVGMIAVAALHDPHQFRSAMGE